MSYVFLCVTAAVVRCAQVLYTENRQWPTANAMMIPFQPLCLAHTAHGLYEQKINAKAYGEKRSHFLFIKAVCSVRKAQRLKGVSS